MRKILFTIALLLLISGCTRHFSLLEIKTGPNEIVRIGDVLTLQKDASIYRGLDKNYPDVIPTSRFQDPNKTPDFPSGSRFTVVQIDTWAGLEYSEAIFTMKEVSTGKFISVDSYNYDFLFRAYRK